MTSGQQKRYASHTPDVRTTILKISSRVKRLAGSSPGREFRLDCVRDETIDSRALVVRSLHHHHCRVVSGTVVIMIYGGIKALISCR